MLDSRVIYQLVELFQYYLSYINMFCEFLSTQEILLKNVNDKTTFAAFQVHHLRIS